jgi:uncharacterized protein YaaR (DUF327 family)
MTKPEDDHGQSAESKGKQLYEAVLASTRPTKKNRDEVRFQLKQDFRSLIKRGTPEEFAEALKIMGKGIDTEEGKQLIAALTKMRDG